MRTFRTALLAATIVAGIPGAAFAQDQREGRGAQGGAERGDRGDRGGRDNDGGGQRPEQQAPRPQAQPDQQARPDMRGGGDRRQWAGGQDRGPDQARQFQGRPDGGRPDGQRFDGRPGGRPDDGQRDDRRFDGNRPGGNDQRGFDGRRDGRFDGRPGGNSDRRFDGRPGGNYGSDRRPGPDRAWRPGYNWRADRSYDWRGYRNSNRGAFQIGRYYAPRGWNQGYRRFGIGYRLPSFFYGQSYWLDDPYDYRLPPAYGQYRWIRYYNDVLLVDLRTGAIVDEIPDFFW